MASSSTEDASLSKSWVVAKLRETRQENVVNSARSLSSKGVLLFLLLEFKTPMVLPLTFKGTHIRELVR